MSTNSGHRKHDILSDLLFKKGNDHFFIERREYTKIENDSGKRDKIVKSGRHTRTFRKTKEDLYKHY